MGQAEATNEEWRRLFDRAIEYKRQACWNWMSDEDFFVVTNPETGERGYCVVLGAGGMTFGLSVYIGPQAGVFLRELIHPSNMTDEDPDELRLSTHAITVWFEDRGTLDKMDLDLIRSLGYKFRGSNEWPMFRRHDPGLESWLPDGEQVRFLTVALEQTMEVAERLRDDTGYSIGEKRLHRVPARSNKGLAWRDEWLPWHPEGNWLEPYEYPNEFKLKQVSKSLKNSDAVWASDFEYAPYMAFGARGERAVYPRMCLWVDARTGLIMDVELGDASDCRELFVEQWLALLEQTRVKPALIVAGSPKAYLTLHYSAEILGIPIRYDPAADPLVEAKESFRQNFIQ